MLGMADGASSAEDSPDDDSDLGHTRTATGHRKHPDDNSNLGCTRTTTEHRKHSSSQTAAQRGERLAAERLQHIAFFTSCSYIHVPIHIHHQLTERIFTLFTYPFFVITHLSIAAWLRCEACVCTLRMPSIGLTLP